MMNYCNLFTLKSNKQEGSLCGEVSGKDIYLYVEDARGSIQESIPLTPTMARQVANHLVGAAEAIETVYKG